MRRLIMARCLKPSIEHLILVWYVNLHLVECLFCHVNTYIKESLLTAEIPSPSPPAPSPSLPTLPRPTLPSYTFPKILLLRVLLPLSGTNFTKF